MKRVLFVGAVLWSILLIRYALAQSSPIAVLVNQDTITVQDLENKLRQQMPTSDPVLAIPEALNTIIIDRLVSQKAARLDISQDSVFQKEKEDFLDQYVLGQLYQEYVASLVSVSEEEAERHYYDNKETIYRIPEQVRVGHILIEPEDDTSIADPNERAKAADRTALQKAEQVTKRAGSEDFPTLARTFSRDYITASRGGDMGYKRRGELLPEIDTTVFAAKPGDILGPFKSQHGYHIIKIYDRIQEGYREFDDSLKKEIESRLRAERTSQRNQAFLDSLKEQVTFIFNEAIIALPETTKVDGAIWCVVINQTDTLPARQIRDELLNYSLYTRSGRMSLEDKKQFLRKKSFWVQLKVLQQLARKLGYYDRPEAKQEMNNFRQNWAEKIVRQQTTQKYEPSQPEIQRYFDSHPEEFRVQYPLHVYHIIFDDSLTAAAVRDTILGGADFVEMARKYYPGNREFKEVAYDLGYIAGYEMSDEFYAAAERLEIGEVSPPVKTFLGYHLIKLIDRKKGQTTEEVKPQIIKTLKEEYQEKAQAEWEASLKKGAKIKIYQEVIDKIDLTRLNEESESGSTTKQ